MKKNKNQKYKWILSAVLLFMLSGCKKLVEIHAPYSSITTDEAFADSIDALSAIRGIYSSLVSENNAIGFGNGAVGIFCGESADDLSAFYSNLDQFHSNTLTSDNGPIAGYFWSQPYSAIYQTNACIEGLGQSTTLQESVKKQFTAEAKFLRAFLYFYLVNLFGDVPYITSTKWATTQAASRTPKQEVFQNIKNDLIESQNNLPDDYSASGNERVRANKWAVTALLARVYLYLGEWKEAENQSSSIINNTGLFNLAEQPNQTFLVNSSEAILQLYQVPDRAPFNITWEGFNLVPVDSNNNPSYFITDQLLNSFEPNDLRRVQWVDSINYFGTTYHFPFKYNMGPAQLVVGQAPTQFETIFRLAEQYLIRAEARANNDNLVGAREDIDMIRSRALLSGTPANTKEDILAAVLQERRVELFAEWGHRWLDLKRLALASSTLQPIKPLWKNSQLLYPIPLSEIQSAPNLVQNPGY